MPEKAGDEVDESWAQTLITVTPEENAAIRTITETTIISAVGDTLLVLGVNEIADRRTLRINTIRRDLFVDGAELEEQISYSDAGCQTFLRGVPKVEFPSVYRDEASQTMYLGNLSSPYTPQSFQDITRTMNERIMPATAKRTKPIQTIVTFEPHASKNYIVDRLTDTIVAEELEENDFTEQATAASTFMQDNLQFILNRVFWLSDPGYCSPEVELQDEFVQTYIKYDNRLHKVVLDADTQTSLTCEPSRSNTSLLSEWSAMKEFTHNIIDECLEVGVLPRTTVYLILDEVIERCASQIHLPYRDKAVQTLAPCNVLEDKDDEVLRKLRIEVVFDTFESSIIVLQVVNILLERACMEVRQEAPTIVIGILNRIWNNSVTIAARLAAIRQELMSHKPMDDILDARKKRLKELLQHKTAAKLCSGTQTELAGVPDVLKVKEQNETVCSICARHSGCYVCEANLDDEQENPAARRQDIGLKKIVRTQDILIAYNPCYVVVAPPSKTLKNSPPIVRRQRPVKPIKSASKPCRPLSIVDLRASASGSFPCKPKTEGQWLDDVRSPGPRSARPEGRSQGGAGALNDWTRIVPDNLISGAWSTHGSSSTNDNIVPRQVGVSLTCLSGNPLHREYPRFPCDDLPGGSVEALRILKNTFNRNEDSCTDCSYDREILNRKLRQGVAPEMDTTCDFVDGESSTKASQDSKSQTKPEYAGSGSKPNEKPYDKGVRVVPVIYLSN